MSRSKYDKDFKSKVLDKGLVKILVNQKKAVYKGYSLPIEFADNEGIVNRFYLSDWNTYTSILRGDNDSIDCALLLIDSKKRKIQKVKSKISDIVLNNNAVFITLTFTDEVLARTSATTRRRYVSRYLKSQGCEYVANIDFSPDIEREHYHAVISTRVDLKAWKYGFSFAEKVRCHNSDLQRVSKYITKLTAHALKVDSTRLIYSRL